MSATTTQLLSSG